MSVIGNEEHKQRVNLSALARSVLEMDRSVFDPEGSTSGFFNRIITSFRDKASASVDTVAKDRMQQLLMKGYPQQIAAQLAEEYREELKRKSNYPQGDSLTFRLNNSNFHVLYEQRAESNAYSAPSKYLKALLEEYARLSPSEREGIYYGKLIDDCIAPAVDAGYILDLQVSGKQFWVKPYGLMADPFNSHLYLVGLASRMDKPGEQDVIASFRITRLEGVKLRRQPSGRISIEGKRQIEKRLQEVGVQYLVGAQDQIKVRLTKAGRKEFLQRSYMRPTPVSVEGDVYHFSCAPMQIRNYFLSFGKEAQVLEPSWLRKEIGKIYRDAAAGYDKNSV